MPFGAILAIILTSFLLLCVGMVYGLLKLSKKYSWVEKD